MWPLAARVTERRLPGCDWQPSFLIPLVLDAQSEAVSYKGVINITTGFQLRGIYLMSDIKGTLLAPFLKLQH